MQLKHFISLSMLFFFILLYATPLLANRNDNLTIDFSERFRLVSWDNPITLDSSKEGGTTFTRNRTSLGLKWKFSKRAEIYFKVTNEFRIYFNPDKDFNIHEIFVDNLYFKIHDIFSLPVTLTLGRQNIFLGEGFVVVDGGTYDGSRSIYFDAIRADIDLSNTGKLSIFSLYAQKTDEFLPVINDREQRMNEHDIRGYGFYYQKKINKNNIDLYYLNKKTDIHDNISWSLSVNTFGSKFLLKLNKSTSLTAEAALQSGSSGDIPIRTYGGHFHLDKDLNNNVFKKITIGGVFLSGEDSCKCTIRGWDPPFSRWPKWSESYIYTLIYESGIANWSNISSVYISFVTRLFKKGYLNTTFNILGAPENDLAPDFPGGAGKYRGFLMINRMNFVISKNLTGHFLWEHFKPGNFYFNGAESYNWIRFELMYKTKTRRK